MFSITRIPVSTGLATCRGLRVLKLRGAKALAAATLVAACATGAFTGNAKAIAFGPNLQGSGSGSIGCDQVRHQLTFYYSAQPESQVYLGQNDSAVAATSLSQRLVVPEYIQVLSYVKPTTYGSWVQVSDNTVLLNSIGNRAVTNLTMYAGQGRYWQAGFYVRVAYPGSGWSQWYWEPAIPYMSLSGSVAANYGFCLT